MYLLENISKDHSNPQELDCDKGILEDMTTMVSGLISIPGNNVVSKDLSRLLRMTSCIDELQIDLVSSNPISAQY